MSLLKKLGMSLASFGLAFALNLENRLYSDEIYIPRDHPTIQAGIDAAKDGDSVIVFQGKYLIKEPLTYHGKNIILNGEDPENTIIHMNEPLNPGRSSVFVFENGETNDAILDGFTITGGGGSPAGEDAGISGGGILCKGASPTIKNNIIIKNGVGAFSPYGGQYGEGGGIYCVDSNAQIVDNIITKNKSHRGGGIMCFKSNIILVNNKIFENATDSDYGGGIGCQDGEGSIIKDNLILRNTTNDEGCGGGIGISGGKMIVENNIIYGNGKSYENWFYPRYGGGVYIGEGEISEIILKRNIIVNNQANITGGGIYIRNQHSPLILNNTLFGNTLDEISKWVDSVDPIIKNCIVLNKTGPLIFYSLISQIELCGQNGNICADPLLVNPNPDPNTLDTLIENGNYDGAMQYLKGCYSLQQDSNCIDTGDPRYLLDPDGTRADMGAVYFDQDRNKFIRGDVNRDEKVDVEDAVTILYHLPDKKFECLDSVDVDDNGKIDENDFIYLFDFLYRNGLQPPSPFPEAGYDLTPDTLACYVCKKCEDADINDDNKVDLLDYAIFANTWLEESSRLGDIYEDNVINFKDLKILADNWLWNYSWSGYED